MGMNSIMDSPKRKTLGGAWPAALIAGLAVSLSLAFFDVEFSIWVSRPSAFASFATMLAPLVVTAVVILLAYALLSCACIFLLGRWFKTNPVPMVLAVGTFIFLAFVLITVSGLRGGLSPAGCARLTVLLLFPLIIAAGVYFIAKDEAQAPRHARIVATFGMVFPLLGAESLLCTWLLAYRLDSRPSFSALVVIAGFALALLMTITLLRRPPRPVSTLRWLGVFTLLLVLSPLATFVAPAAAVPARRPSRGAKPEIRRVILLSVDTLRTDALGCYNPKRVRTPNFDRLAHDAVVFDRAISPAPWTLPAFASVMSGVLPPVHQATRTSRLVPQQLRTLAEELRDAGYFTAAIGSNSVLHAESNISQGFDHYHFFQIGSLGSSLGARVLRRLLPQERSSQYTTRHLTDLAVDWLEANADRDFFLWLHYLDPHYPYEPPAPYLAQAEASPRIGRRFDRIISAQEGVFVPTDTEKKWIRRLYDAEVRYVDEYAGKFLGALRRMHLYDESLIVFVSDHGEEFWEHGGAGHGHTLYDELIHVPFFIKLPYQRSTGRVDQVVTTAAIAPTVLDLCGVAFDPESMSVASLSPLLLGDTAAIEAPPVLSTGLYRFYEREALLFGGLKYVRSLITGREELYDLASDPGEQLSIAHSAPEKIEAARTVLEALKKQAQQLRTRLGLTAATQEMSNDRAEQLRALGYL